MTVEVLGDVTDVETIAIGTRIRELPPLHRLYGKGFWRKMQGIALIRLVDGRIRTAQDERGGDLRVVDESGEDSLFSADRFAAIDLPPAVKTSLLTAS